MQDDFQWQKTTGELPAWDPVWHSVIVAGREGG